MHAHCHHMLRRHCSLLRRHRLLPCCLDRRLRRRQIESLALQNLALSRELRLSLPKPFVVCPPLRVFQRAMRLHLDFCLVLQPLDLSKATFLLK